MMHSVSVNHCPSYISQLVQPVSSSSRRQQCQICRSENKN